MRPRRRFIFRLAAAFFSLAVILVAAEVVLRLFFRDDYRLPARAEKARAESIWTKSPDPILIYAHRPDYMKDGVRVTEAHGILRPTDVAPGRRPRLFRVLVLGDSIAAGLPLPYAVRFPTILEDRLRADLAREGLDVEVLNFAVNGYGTLQEARDLERRAADFPPDAILVAYCMNDPGNSATPAAWFVEADPPRLFIADLPIRLIRGGWRADPRTHYIPKEGPTGTAIPYWRDLYDPRAETWGSVVEGFGRIASVADRVGAPVAVLVFPFLLDGGPTTDVTAAFHRQVREEAERRGFLVRDLSREFSAVPVSAIRIEAGDIYHANPRGHAIAAIAARVAIEEIRAARVAASRRPIRLVDGITSRRF